VVGQDGEEPVQYVLDRGDSALVLGGGRVVEVVGRDEFVDGVDVVLIPDLFDVAAHHGLVFFRHRLSPFRQSPTIANVTIENVPGKCKRRKGWAILRRL